MILIPTVSFALSPVKSGVYRIWGETRYETSFHIADALNEQTSAGRFDAVVIASGTNFPDALAGSYLATTTNAPILMYNAANDAAVHTFILENLAPSGTVYLLGGTNALPEALEQTLSAYRICRLQGRDRFDTNLQILKETGVTGGEILVCTGWDFADSLSASATNQPILLVNNRLDVLTESQKEYLGTLTAPSFCIIGGENAVNKHLEMALMQFGSVRRIGGATRLETSIMVADTFFDAPKSVSLAYSHNFPDGLSGGPLAFHMDGPIILTGTGTETAAKTYVQENGITNGIVLGGEKLISDNSVRLIFGLNADAAIPAWEPATYQISYTLNGGKNHPDNPAQYTYGDNILLGEPTRENYDFQGWYLDKSFTTQVTSISPGTAKNLTLYAKWSLAALNIPGEGMNDMIWSWWYYPQVVSSGDSIYWGYATSEGYCGVASYNRTTDKTSTTALKKATTVDDHNGLALTTMDDGRIVCVYAGGHNSDNNIHIRISNEPGSIENFDTQIILRSSGKTCYGQILKYNKKYYIFYRVNNNSWGFRSSEDCLNWTEERILVKSTMQYYCKFMPTTTDGMIRVCMYSNPTAADPRIRMGFFDLNTETLLNSDAKTVLGTQSVSYDLFDILITPPEGQIQRMFDVAITAPDEPAILYTTFNKKSGSNDSIYYLYHAGTSYKICDGGKPLWDPKYQLGASFLDENTIIAGRHSTGTDYIEIYRFDGTSVTLQQSVDQQSTSDGSRNARPIVDINGKAFLWHNGYYDPKSYKNFNTSARMYLIEADTIVE